MTKTYAHSRILVSSVFSKRTYITKICVFHNYFLPMSGLKLSKSFIRPVLNRGCPEAGRNARDFRYIKKTIYHLI